MKTFLSAEDIQLMAVRGQSEVYLDEDTVLTDLARDEAQRLGIRLVSGSVTPQSRRSGRPVSPPPRALTGKPKGCQHGGRPPARAATSRGTDAVVNELVNLVKKL